MCGERGKKIAKIAVVILIIMGILSGCVGQWRGYSSGLYYVSKEHKFSQAQDSFEVVARSLHNFYQVKKQESNGGFSVLFDLHLLENEWQFIDKEEKKTLIYVPTEACKEALDQVMEALQDSEYGGFFGIRIYENQIDFMTTYQYDIIWTKQILQKPKALSSEHYTERLSFHWHQRVFY